MPMDAHTTLQWLTILLKDHDISDKADRLHLTVAHLCQSHWALKTFLDFIANAAFGFNRDFGVSCSSQYDLFQDFIDFVTVLCEPQWPSCEWFSGYNGKSTSCCTMLTVSIDLVINGLEKAYSIPKELQMILNFMQAVLQMITSHPENMSSSIGRITVVCSNKVAQKRLVRRHSRNGPQT